MSPEQRAQLQGLAESLLEDMDLRWQVDRLAGNLQRAFPEAGWENRFRFRGDDPMGMGEATDAAGRLRDLDELEGFLRSANSPAALSEVDLDKVAPVTGRGCRQVPRPAGQAGQAARGGRPDRPARGTVRAHAQGHPAHRPAGPVRPLRPADQGPGRQPRHHLDRDRPRPRGDDQALRVRRPVQPRPVAHRAQRRPPGRQRRARPAPPRRLRGDRDRGADPLGHRAPARPVAVDAHARQLRAGQEDGHGAAHPDHVPVPPRLPGPGRVLRGGPGDRARGPAHRQLGLRLRDEPPARPDPGPQDARPPAGDQADHPGHRRRADRPHRPLSTAASATSSTSTTRRSPRRWS